MFRTMVIDALLNRPSLHCYWSGQHRGKECRPPRPPYGLPTEYYPFKWCQVPLCHPAYPKIFLLIFRLLFIGQFWDKYLISRGLEISTPYLVISRTSPISHHPPASCFHT